MNLFEPARKLARDLEVGEKFGIVDSGGIRHFGLRAKCQRLEPAGFIWIANLETGEVLTMKEDTHVEVIPSFIDLLVLIHEGEVKPVETMEDVLDFLGVDDLNPFPEY